MSSIVCASGLCESSSEYKICGNSKKVFFRGVAPGIETSLTVYDTIFVTAAKWNRDAVEELYITCKCSTCGAKAFEVLEFKYADHGDDYWETEVEADWCSHCATQSLLAESDSETEYYTPCPSPPTHHQAERESDNQ